MMYLVFTVFSLHLLVLPMVIGAAIVVDSDTRKGKLTVRFFGIPVFWKKLDYDRSRALIFSDDARTTAEQNSDNNKKKSSALGKKIKNFLLKVAFETAKRIRVRELELSADIGAGDAAVTAVAVGSLQIAYSQVCAFLNYRDGNVAEIKPDYNSERINIDFTGIFSLCFADIIYAASVVIFKKSNKRSDKRSANANTVAERTTRASD